MKVLSIVFLFLVACSKGSPDSTPGQSIASIPAGCVQVTEWDGAHLFPPDEVLPAHTYECGVREGKICYYYETQSGNLQHDTRCN